MALLTADAWLTMPPETLEYQGPAAIAAGYESLPWWSPGTFHLVPTRANGQPAFAYYLREFSAPTARAHGFIVLILSLASDKISAITRFDGTGLVPRFGLPQAIAVS